MCVNNVSPDLSINTPVPGRSQGLLENVQRLHKPHRDDQRATKTRKFWKNIQRNIAITEHPKRPDKE